jgi:dipeptidyl aminopeptidase/acylaminoacyl peptidase
MQAHRLLIASWFPGCRDAARILLLGVAALCAVGAAAQVGPLQPVEHFVRPPAIGAVALSPSGRQLAITGSVPGARARLSVIDLGPSGQKKVVAAFSDADIDRAMWLNDKRLVFWVSTRDRSLLRSRVEGVYAVNADGSGLRELIADDVQISDRRNDKTLPWYWFVRSSVHDGSADVIVGETIYESNMAVREVVLHRLDTLTGRKWSISEGAPPNTTQWVLAADDKPRYVMARRGQRNVLHWREAPEKPYAEVASFDAFGTDELVPVGLDDDGALLVTSAHGRDTAAVYRFDPRTRKLEDEPVIALPGFDLAPGLERDPVTQRVVGLHLRSERPASVWFDEGMSKLQAGIDRALPGRFNRIHCWRCQDEPFVVVFSSSNQDPGEYFLLDRATMKLQSIAKARPWIDERAQPTRSYHRVAARDGLSLPVYLTRPVGAAEGKALPTVVLVHGGPFLRGHQLGWSAWSAFLANRGYLVIEVEFRGSTGYGNKHFSAGWKQWGLAMQDDLADALAWAAKQGWSDPRRACIVGGSYGGYAALMGPVRHPDAYRCAAAFAAVTDLTLMNDITWSDLSDHWQRYGMPKLVGDPKADAEQFIATSPLKQVARIKVPLLVAHGALDRRVPIDHSRLFRSAAEAAKVAVEFVVYPEEGHGFYQFANEADFLGKVEKFLDRHIGGLPN